MAYFQTDDIPVSTPGKVKPNLTLKDPDGNTIMKNVKSFEIRRYYKLYYAPGGCNGKRIWREELTKLGYKIENTQ